MNLSLLLTTFAVCAASRLFCYPKEEIKIYCFGLKGFPVLAGGLHSRYGCPFHFWVKNGELTRVKYILSLTHLYICY